MIDIFSKAKAAKLIRELVDRFLDMEASTGKEVREEERGGEFCVIVVFFSFVFYFLTSLTRPLLHPLPPPLPPLPPPLPPPPLPPPFAFKGNVTMYE